MTSSTIASNAGVRPDPVSLQGEIYWAGLDGIIPSWPTDLTALEQLVKAQLPAKAFWYVAGGAGTGGTMRANREAFDRWRIRPRMLREATRRKLATEILGTPAAAPVLLAPVGVLSIVHPDAELAVARASASLGLPMVLSTASSHTIEEVAEASDQGGGQRWFQLYWPNEDAVTLSILQRARRSGYRTLVVTLDTWQLGYRPHDLDSAYLPFLLGQGTAIPFTDPAFCAGLQRPVDEDLLAAVRRWVPMFTGTSLVWEKLPFLLDNWDGPVVVKGVQHPEDAARAVEAGVAGVIVSNHGGRQIDGAMASLDALPGIVSEIGDKAAVMFDSGIRTGADAVKALALGADAVLVGRPYVYGLGLGGEAGVRHVLRCLLAEIDITLGLAGISAVADLDTSLLIHT